jgi:hypothetical protein
MLGLLLALALPAAITAESHAEDANLANGKIVLVIRHGEQQSDGFGLSAEGVARADAYPNYFKSFTVDGQPLRLDYIFAGADSAASHRPRLTVEPTGEAFGLPVDSSIGTKHVREMAEQIRSLPAGASVLICWRHGEIANLLNALGADPAEVLPRGRWPNKVFDWVIQLRFSPDGQLREIKKIVESMG